MSIVVKSQKDLEAALKSGAADIIIDSPDGVWLSLDNRDSSHVVAWGSSHVEARGSSHVVAWGSSHVVAWDSSHVEARGSSHVVAWGSSHVVAWGSSHVEAWDSSHVVAWGSSHVVAWGSSHVVAWGSSHVVAWDSSHVVAWGSSHVVAWDSSHVVARGSSHVVAWGSSHVEASKYVGIHLHSKRVKLSGGVVIDVTDIDLEDRDTWLDYHGVKVTRGKAIVYKAVDQDFNAGQGYTLTNYPVGGKVTAADWKPTQACGNGLHFGYRPAVARGYFNGSGAPRFLAVEIGVKDLVALGDKCKAPAGKVLFEVDIDGAEIMPSLPSDGQGDTE